MSTVRTVRDIAEIPAAQWDALMRAVGAGPFYRHAFLDSYQISGLGNALNILYLTLPGATPDAPLEAALPAYLVDGAEIGRIFGLSELTRRPSRVLVSHLPHWYETVLPHAANDPNVALPALWEALLAAAAERGAAFAGLINVEHDSALHRAAAGLPGIRTVPSAARWFLDTGGLDGIAGYLATLGRSTRRTLRAARRRAEQAGALIDVTRYGIGTPSGAIEDVVRMCAGSAAKHGSSYYPAAALTEFLHRLEDYLVVRVQLEERTLAASVCFLHNGELHTWAGGALYPPELNWSPNHVLFHAELELGFRLGVKRIECGRRNDEFKARHRLERCELVACLGEVR
jgi:predicted N-acyltransferase